jgi:hypothetical protein
MGELVQFVPRSRPRVKILLPIACRVPNAIEEVLLKAAQDTSPCEMIPYHDPDKEPA